MYSIPRYPYLITQSNSEQSTTTQRVSALQDGDQSESSVWAEDVDMGWEEDSNDLPVHYLALDTNILINHLPLIQNLYKLLEPIQPSPLILLIPTTVISELDGLTRSNAPCDHRPASIGECARLATNWMLSVNRRPRPGLGSGRSIIRGQKWKERSYPDRTKNDDRILDCCLYFRNPPDGTPAKGVTLWTDDRNLSLNAENEDIPTLNTRYPSLASIITATGVTIPDSTWARMPSLHSELQSEREVDHDGGMELDEDLIRNDHHTSLSDPYYMESASTLSSPLMQSPNTSPSKRNSALSSKTPVPFATATNTYKSRYSPNTSRTIKPSDQATQPLLFNLSQICQQILATISHTASQLTSTANSLDPPLALLKLLEQLEHDLTTTSTSTLTPTSNSALTPAVKINDISTATSTIEYRQTLLRAIASLRTIISFFDPKFGGRRPRTGETGDAVVVLADMLVKLGIVLDVKEPLCLLSDEIRKL